MTNLESLLVHNNEITTLVSFQFGHECKKIELLDLQYNKLVSIEENAFNGLTGLEWLL